MEVYVKKIISIFSLFFLDFNHDFVMYIDFTHVAAWNTETVDVTNNVTHIICNTNYNIIVLIYTQNWWEK